MEQAGGGIVGDSSDHDNAKPIYGYKIKLIIYNKHDFINFFTLVLTNSTLLQISLMSQD
jgi:hypothetical protein